MRFRISSSLQLVPSPLSKKGLLEVYVVNFMSARRYCIEIKHLQIGFFHFSFAFVSFSTVPPKPACNQVYNLFHPFDPSASRIEPLIIHQFSNIPAVNVPRYQRFPLGDGQSHLVNNVIGAYSELFVAQATNSRPQSRPGLLQRDSDLSTTSLGSCDGSDSPRGGTDSDAGGHLICYWFLIVR